MEVYSHLIHHITYCMYGALHKKPTTLWLSGFQWVPKPRCGTKQVKKVGSRRQESQSYWKCAALKKSRGTRHPNVIQNMQTEEKIQLPVLLVFSLLEAILSHHAIAHSLPMHETRSEPHWLLALFESFGSWYPACAKFGIWHVAVSYTGVCVIDDTSKHVNIPMDLGDKSVDTILHAVYHSTGFLLPSNLVAIVASPPCITFSGLDSRWKHHRHHDKANKPAKSQLAKQHDAMVLKLLTSLWPDIHNPWQVQGKGVVEQHGQMPRRSESPAPQAKRKRK